MPEVPPVKVPPVVPPVQGAAASPGRIAPIQLKGKGIPNAASIIYSQAQKIGAHASKKEKDAFDVGAGLALGGPIGGGIAVAGKIQEARVTRRNTARMNDFVRAIESGDTGYVPKTKKRITALGKWLFIYFSVCIDVIQILLDIVAVGVIVNRIIDIVAAVIFIFYALFKGLTIADNPAIFGSLLGTIAGEFIPGLDVLPFFTADALLIIHAIKQKDKARQDAINEEARSVVEEKERADWTREYEKRQAQEAEEDELEQEAEEEEGSSSQNEDGPKKEVEKKPTEIQVNKPPVQEPEIKVPPVASQPFNAPPVQQPGRIPPIAPRKPL